MNSKRLTIFGILPWFALSLFSVILYPAIFRLSCFFQSNWVFCPVEASAAMKVVSFGLITACVGGLVITGCLFWKRFSSDNPVVEGRYKIVAAVFVILAVLVVPFGSGDVNYYFSAGKALNAGINPFINSWTFFRPFVGPQNVETLTGFSYGPLAAMFFETVNTLSFGNPAIFVLIWKLFVASAFLACGILSFRLLSLLGSSTSRPRFYLFWFLQPLFLFEVLASGHFDVVWLVFVLLAIWSSIKNNWWLVFPLLTVGIWIKFIPLLMVPFFVLWWWNEISKFNWRKHVLQLLLSVTMSVVITFISWWPFWRGFGVFNSIILQSKWAVSSWFAVIYYSLKPIFTILFHARDHWLLTRFVHATLFVVLVYLLYPYLKKTFRVVLKKEQMSALEFVQFIFFGMLVYLSIWQKSFWPWYPIWIIPIGLVVFEKTRNVEVRRIIMWLSLAPFIFYPVWHLNWLANGVDSAGKFWFWWVFVLIVWAYPLFNLFKIRKANFNI